MKNFLMPVINTHATIVEDEGVALLLARFKCAMVKKTFWLNKIIEMRRNVREIIIYRSIVFGDQKMSVALMQPWLPDP